MLSDFYWKIHKIEHERFSQNKSYSKSHSIQFNNEVTFKAGVNDVIFGVPDSINTVSYLKYCAQHGTFKVTHMRLLFSQAQSQNKKKISTKINQLTKIKTKARICK